MGQLADAAEIDKQVISVQETMGQTDHTSPSHSGQEKASCNATQSSSNKEAVQDNMPPFLNRPLEIRNQIYGYLLSTKYTKVDFVDEDPGYIPGWKSRARRVYHFHPAILAVNRQINHEAGQILRENLFVKFVTDAFVNADKEDPCWHGLPIIALGCMASRVRYHAMELTLISDTEDLDHPYWIFMFSGDDLTTFCRILLRSGEDLNPKSSLSIAITDLAPAMMTILKLMEPFRRLYSMASVKITGKIEAEYKSDLIARMLRRAWDTDAYFQEYQDTMEQGDQAATNKDYPTAIASYKRAWEEGSDFCASYKASEIILESGKFRGQSFDLAFDHIKSVLEMKLAVTCLNLGNHTHAREWISRALVDLYDCLYQYRRSGISFDTISQASEGLELAERAVEEMKEEVQRNPADLDLVIKQGRLKLHLEYVKKWLQGGDGGLGSFMGG